MKKKQTKGMSKKGILGLTALAVAAAAGTYFLYGSKKATANRKKVKSWALKAKGEVLEKLEQLKENVDEGKYHDIVDRVTSKYKALKDVSAKELAEMTKDLKANWKEIVKNAR